MFWNSKKRCQKCIALHPRTLSLIKNIFRKNFPASLTVLLVSSQNNFSRIRPDNALSFSNKGSHIEISLWSGKRGAIIEVKDNGPGIPKESLNKVFERFYTYRPHDKNFGNNSGLGLSICKQIVKAHGGSIVAANRENGGAIFTVVFPLIN